MDRKLFVRKAKKHPDIADRDFYVGVRVEHKGHEAESNENFIVQETHILGLYDWYAAVKPSFEPDGRVAGDFIIFDADTGEVLRKQTSNFYIEGEEKEEFTKVEDLNPMDCPITETDYWKFMVKRPEPNTIRSRNLYLISIGFRFGIHTLSKDAFQQLRLLHDEYWRRVVKEKQS